MRSAVAVVALIISTGVACADKPKNKPPAPAPAPQAERPCGSAANAYSYLKSKYGEKPFAELHDADNHDIVLFVSPDTYSWTLFEDMHDGKWCALASGTDFKPADQKKFDKLLGKSM